MHGCFPAVESSVAGCGEQLFIHGGKVRFGLDFIPVNFSFHKDGLLRFHQADAR